MRPMQRPRPPRLLPLALCNLLGSTASAAPTVGIPAGASHVVVAPQAAAFASDFTRLLSSTAALGGPSPESLGKDLERRTGLPLLDAARLADAGVDTTRDWISFDKGGSRYLGLWVKDRSQLARALDAWAASRLLKARETKNVGKNGLWVTYARAQGTRPACGYLVQGERAVVLLDPGERSAGLEAALAALDDAPPLRPAADGTLLVRLDAGAFAREAWAGFSASERGIEANGNAREVPSGWFSPDAAKSGWVAAAAQSGAGELVLRARVLAGPKASEALSKALAPLGADDQAQAAVGKAATGPVELFVPRLARAWKRTGQPFGELLGLLSPTLVMPGGAAAEPAVRASKNGSRLRTTVAEGALVVGSATSAPKAPPLGAANACTNGRAVLAASWSPAAAARSLDGLNLLEAMGDELLLGLYALNSEYGRFLARLPGGSLLACQDGTRVTWTARWPVPAPGPTPR